MMGRRKFSGEELDNMVKLYELGFTVKECSNKTGISESYIKNILEKRNIQTRPSGFQFGNSFGKKTQSTSTRDKIRQKHLKSGHKPTEECYKKGQPRSLLSRWKNHKKDYVLQFFNRYKRDAEKRNKKFLISYCYFRELVFDCCYYCGRLPSKMTINYKSYKDLNGVDRKDSGAGYTEENCVTCCGVCNRMKWILHHDIFISKCKEISENFRLKGDI